MIGRIQELLEEAKQLKFQSAEDIEQYRIRLLGKKGELNALFDAFKLVEPAQKKAVGQGLNVLKNTVQEVINMAKANVGNMSESKSYADLDLTSPVNFQQGHRHPMSIMTDRIIEIFSNIGFAVMQGPEIEDDNHNFSALNFSPEHPARDMQDTFFVEKKSGFDDIALRTHTSSVQVRVMETQKPPIRAIFPGRVYRNEAISARAHCFFHQVEGLYVDKNVSFADLKKTLLYFAKEMFGEKTKIRLRPSYFPFTEPSAEMDIACNLCEGKGCSFCKHTTWVEILGCGMVDPAVLENCGLDSTVYSGFAFGMGIERQTNLKFKVNDLRLFSENDKRFLEQF